MTGTQQEVAVRVVLKVLRSRLGFTETKGKHKHGAVYRNREGITCRPNMRKKTMTYAALYQLGQELEGKRVVSRRRFMRMVKEEEKA